MVKRLYESFETLKFIRNYPGITEEEKVFMKKIHEECSTRYVIIRDAVLKSSFISTALLTGYIIKRKPDRSIGFRIMIIFPVFVLVTSFLVPFLDFHLSLNHYKSQLSSSPVSSRVSSLSKS